MGFGWLTSCSWVSQEAVHNVGTEVDTEADADDEDVHAGHVDGEAPPVHEAGHVCAGEEDAHHHQQGAPPATQGDQGRDEDADWGGKKNVDSIISFEMIT